MKPTHGYHANVANRPVPAVQAVVPVRPRFLTGFQTTSNAGCPDARSGGDYTANGSASTICLPLLSSFIGCLYHGHNTILYVRVYSLTQH